MTKVCVLGVGGFIGKNIVEGMQWTGVTRQELDLTDQLAVEKYFKTHRYDVVIHCAVVGGSRLKNDEGAFGSQAYWRDPDFLPSKFIVTPGTNTKLL